MFQWISESGFPRVAGDFRWGFDSGPRVGRASGTEPTHRTAPDRPTGHEQPSLPLADLLRQSVYSRLAGYEDVNDAERVSQDPTFRLIGSEKTWDRGAALTSRLQSFETELLAEPENLAGLGAINRELIAKAEAMDSPAAGGAGHRQH